MKQMTERTNVKTIFLVGSFFAGFALMVIELVAVRIMAPMVGASVFTWTSVIGVMLLGLSVGSYLGGRIIDTFPKTNILGTAFLASSLAVTAIPLSLYASGGFFNAQYGIFLLNVSLSFALFFAPALILGTIQPMIVKLYAKNHSTLGQEYGLLSSLWSAGSIFGVFLTGFYLISHFGILSIVYGIAVILCVFGVIFFWHHQKDRTRDEMTRFVILLIAIILSLSAYHLLQSSGDRSAPAILFEKNSAYYHVKVIDAPFAHAGMSRFLFLDADAHSIEPKSEQGTAKKSLLYTDIYPIFEAIKEKNSVQTIHVIGGGAYTLPKNFARYYPDAKVSVSEIDPEVEKTAERYFDLDASVIPTDYDDPRHSFRLSNASYDLIFGDAYNSFVSVPGHLLTNEFNQSVKKHLKPDGVYAVNIASAVEGKGSLLFQSVYRTFVDTFPNTIVIAFASDSSDSSVLQNIILIGSISDKPIDRTSVGRALDTSMNHERVVAHIVPEDEISSLKEGVFLTDDFAPVENLMLPAVEGYFETYFEFYKTFLGKKLFL